MMSITTLRTMFVVGIVIIAAACAPKQTTGTDPNTDSTATNITWTDGQPAVQIKCGQPGGCLSRAVAMCGDNYKTLKMENFPTDGNMIYVRGPATATIRCAQR